MIVLLVLSTFFPSAMTMSEKEWTALQQSNNLLYTVASVCSTPHLVKTPFFAIVSGLLFLSTLACTLERCRTWFRSRVSDFAKDKAFSFSTSVGSEQRPEVLGTQIKRILQSGNWKLGESSSGDEEGMVAGDKGSSGFWGSIVFHVGLLFCFLAGPVTAMTAFRGEMLITEDQPLPLRTAVSCDREKASLELPDVGVVIHDLKGIYFQGRYKSDFSGIMTIRERERSRDIPFAVNQPLELHGFQFSLHQYGFAPRVVLELQGMPSFDYYLNLRNPDEGDWFELPGGIKALVMFFPDFIREGTKIGSASQDPKNPVIMVKLFADGKEIFKGLFKPGESMPMAGGKISVPDYKHWANLIVTREAGLHLAVAGFILVMLGLLVRFISNERRLEFQLIPLDTGTQVRVRGYSRYYPAFLEKEVQTIAQMLGKESQQ